MTDHRGGARGRPSSGLRLPRTVGGLIHAMRAAVAGDAAPLEAWDRDRFPILRQVLEAWTSDALLADRLASHVVREVFRAVIAGRDAEIHAEIAWMTGVAWRTRARIRRDERPFGEPLPPHVKGSGADPLDELIRQESRERIRGVIAILPAKYRLALRFRYVYDLSEPEVVAALNPLLGIGLAGTRRILRLGREMVKTGLQGRNPRTVFPARYTRDEGKNRRV